MFIFLLGMILGSLSYANGESAYGNLVLQAQKTEAEIQQLKKQLDPLLPDLEAHLIDSQSAKPRWISPWLRTLVMSPDPTTYAHGTVVVTDGTYDELTVLHYLRSQPAAAWIAWGERLLFWSFNWQDRRVTLGLDPQFIARQLKEASVGFSGFWLLDLQGKIISNRQPADWGKSLAKEPFVTYFENHPGEELWKGSWQRQNWIAYQVSLGSLGLNFLALQPESAAGFSFKVWARWVGLAFLFLALALIYFIRTLDRPASSASIRGVSTSPSSLASPAAALSSPVLNFATASAISDLGVNSALGVATAVDAPSLSPGLGSVVLERAKLDASPVFEVPIPPDHLFSDEAIAQALRAIEMLPDIEASLSPSKKGTLSSNKEKVLTPLTEKPLSSANTIPNREVTSELDFEDLPSFNVARKESLLDQYITVIRKPGEAPHVDG